MYFHVFSVWYCGTITILKLKRREESMQIFQRVKRGVKGKGNRFILDSKVIP